MGVISDLLSSAKTFDTSSTHTGNDRAITQNLKNIIQQIGDFAYPSGYAVGNEVQSIAQHVHATGGTYTLTFTLGTGQTFTTGNIAYDAIGSTITTAINSAATSLPVTGWTNGDIVVGGGPLSSGAVTLTFSGNSVKGLNNSQTTINGALLTYTGGTATLGAATTSVQGSGSFDEIQSIAAFGNTVNGGHYTLTLTINGGGPVTTGSLLYSANAAAVTTAIDLVSGVTAGHIVVTGGPLTSGAFTLTFSGADVDKTNQGQTTISNVDLTATVTGTTGAVSTTDQGQTNRAAWAALDCFSIITSAPPVQGSDVVSVTVDLGKGEFPFGLEPETVKALIIEAAYQDNNQTVKDMLYAALGF